MMASRHGFRWAGICTALFASVFFVGLNLWSAYGIFVQGQIESKFGGPWENFVLGLELSAAFVGVSAAGYLGAAIMRRKRLLRATRAVRLVASTAAGAIALAAAGSGRLGIAVEALLPMDSILGLAIGFFAVGFVLSVLAAEIGARAGGSS